MSLPSILSAEHLLDWPTALVGVRRGWMTPADVSDLAVARIVDEEAAIDSDLAELTSAGALPLADVEDHLVSLAERFPVVEEETAVRRWLLASLIDLDRANLDEDVVLARLQEIYAEFGFPDELRYVSPYNLTFDEWVSDPQVGSVTSSPVRWFERVLREIRASLVPARTAEDG